MTIPELHTRLQGLGFLSEEYYLHGLYGSTNDNDKLSMTIKKGKYTIEYEVYFRERGEKHSSKTFTSEHDACEHFLKQLLETRTLQQALKNRG